MFDWIVNEWAQIPMLEKLLLNVSVASALGLFIISFLIKLLSTIHSTYRISPNSSLKLVPCSGLDAALKFLFSKRAYERVFSQVIGDFQLDYMELISQGREWKARWLVFCTYVSVLLTVANYLCVSVVKQIKAIWTVI